MAKFESYDPIDAVADDDIIVIKDASSGTTVYATFQQIGDYIDTDQGFVTGPASATDNALARFDATTGKLLQDSGILVDDNGNVAIGDASTNSLRAVNVSKTVTDNVNPGYAWWSEVKSQGTISNAGVYSNIYAEGASSKDHVVAFQGYSRMDGAGTLTWLYGYYGINVVTAGTVTTSVTHEIASTVLSGGTVGTNIGLAIRDQSGVGTTNWSIYVEAGAKSYHGSAIKIGTNTTTTSDNEMLLVSRAGANDPMMTLYATDSNAAIFAIQNSTTGTGAGDGVQMVLNANEDFTVLSYDGFIKFQTVAAGDSIIFESAKDIEFGVGAIATTATSGFVSIPTCAGAPTGTPTPTSGLAPVVYDSTNNKLMVYDGAWIGVTLS